VDCDAVILNLPHGLHDPVSVFFLEKGIHVLVEKPMANTAAECEEMLKASEKSGAKLAVAHVQRFFKANMKIKEIVESGELGTLCMYDEQRSINYFLPTRPAWFTNKKMAGGGIVMNYGAHAFDKIFYITGAKPTFVNSSYANCINDRDVEGHAQIFAKFDNGVSATITLSGYSDVVYEAYYYFTKGALKLTSTSKLEIRREGEKVWTEVPDSNDNLAFVREIDEFCKYVRGEKSSIPDGEYGKAIVEAIDALYACEQ
jgi:predicted dehydrogenase